MAHIPCPHVAQLSLLFTHNVEAVNCELTFDLYDTSDVIFTDPGATSTEFWNDAISDLKPYLVPEVILNGVVFEDKRVIPYAGADYPKTSTAGGYGSGSDGYPTNAALAVKRSTATLGRSGRGRVYWPIWDHSLISQVDVVGSAYAALVTTALGTFQAHLEVDLSPAKVAVVSTQHAGASRVTGVSYPVTGWAVTDLNLDCQRRRLLGRGR